MAPEVLVPRPKPHIPPSLVSVDGRTYPLRSARIRSRADAGLAQTTLIQEFENPHDEPLEVIYTMPLPADGAVLGYLVRMGDRVIRGEIETREKAAATYKEALYDGKTAGILEENRADTFQQRLGNLPARTKAEIEIEVLHPLSFLPDAGARGPVWEYRFPTVVGVRYQGGPGRVKDAEAIDENRAQGGEIPTRVALDLVVGDAAASTATSPSHAIAALLGADATHIRLADDARLDRDLIVQWPAAAPDVGVTVAEGPGLEGDKGRYAQITVTPPAVPRATYHRDLTILIDASGSMSGEPIETAKRIAAGLLANLGEGDRFELLAFASKVQELSSRMERVSPGAVRKGIQKIESLQAGGATEMQSAVQEALASLRSDSQRQIVLLTDGEIGFERNVMETLSRGTPEGVRLHVVGIGAAPNRTLTFGLARGGRGLELLVPGVGEAAEAVARLSAATARPVLTELVIGGSAIVSAAPARPRDVFAGQPVVVAVEVRTEGGTVEVGGRLAGSSETWVWRTTLAAANAPAATVRATTLPIGALYGRERISDIEAGIGKRLGRRDEDEAVEALGLRHRIVSRRTSLVAVAEEPSVDPRAPRRRERLAVELPYGVSAEGVGLGMGGMAFGLMETIGLAAVYRIAPGAARRPFEGVALPRFRTPGHEQHEDMDESLAISTGDAVGTLVRIDGDVAVIEIEVPHVQFRLPTRSATLTSDTSREAEVEVVDAQSSPAGPHKPGTLVRLAVRITDRSVWAVGNKIVIRWDTPVGGFRLVVEVPPGLEGTK